MSAFSALEVRYLNDWLMDVDKKTGLTVIKWMGESGPGLAEIPTWVAEKIIERAREDRE